MTIKQVIRQLRDVLNIPPDAEAIVNDMEVGPELRVRDGDTVEFVRVIGRKGGINEFWSESEVTDVFGADAVEEMRGLGIEPVQVTVYTSDQIASFQAQRVGNPEPSKHGLIVDPGSFAASYRDQRPLVLGNTISFNLFARLARRPNVFVDFNRLRNDVWKDERTEDATISRAISRLRKQLQEGGLTGITLESQRHVVRLKLE
ncbi:MAG: helix-turn-helix domain-containing protein [Planctomycetaceae bacterium]